MVGLAKVVSPTIEDAVHALGFPHAFVGVVIALLVLLPESISAVRAAARDRVQTSLNLAYGSAMASIGLTIPTIAVASIWLDGPLHLGLESMQMVLLFITRPGRRCSPSYPVARSRSRAACTWCCSRRSCSCRSPLTGWTAPGGPEDSVGMHAIRAAHAFDGERFLPGGATVLVEDERIVGVEGPRHEPPEGCPLATYDGTLLPGLVDAHVHLIADATLMNLPRVPTYPPEQVDADHRRLARRRGGRGVTTVRDLGDVGYRTLAFRDRAEPGRPPDRRAGPPLTGPRGTATTSAAWSTARRRSGPRSTSASSAASTWSR